MKSASNCYAMTDKDLLILFLSFAERAENECPNDRKDLAYTALLNGLGQLQRGEVDSSGADGFLEEILEYVKRGD